MAAGTSAVPRVMAPSCACPDPLIPSLFSRVTKLMGQEVKLIAALNEPVLPVAVDAWLRARVLLHVLDPAAFSLEDALLDSGLADIVRVICRVVLGWEAVCRLVVQQFACAACRRR